MRECNKRVCPWHVAQKNQRKWGSIQEFSENLKRGYRNLALLKDLVGNENVLSVVESMCNSPYSFDLLQLPALPDFLFYQLNKSQKIIASQVAGRNN